MGPPQRPPVFLTLLPASGRPASLELLVVVAALTALNAVGRRGSRRVGVRHHRATHLLEAAVSALRPHPGAQRALVWAAALQALETNTRSQQN